MRYSGHPEDFTHVELSRVVKPSRNRLHPLSDQENRVVSPYSTLFAELLIDVRIVDIRGIADNQATVSRDRDRDGTVEVEVALVSFLLAR